MFYHIHLLLHFPDSQTQKNKRRFVITEEIVSDEVTMKMGIDGCRNSLALNLIVCSH